MKDTAYYDSESTKYSEKRYPEIVESYIQYFFTRRLTLTHGLLGKILGRVLERQSLLEVGCADGIVVRAIAKAFPGRFMNMTGIDISPKMIEVARRTNDIPEAFYTTRGAYAGAPGSVHIVIETGVANYTDVAEELRFAHEQFVQGGHYLLSLAGKSSLHNMLKHEDGYSDFRSYGEYEKMIKERFVIREVRGCGVFIPYLWRMPALARIIQPIMERVIGSLVPSLCHEKIYLLRKK